MRTRLRLAALAIAVPVLLASCGGDDDDEASSVTVSADAELAADAAASATTPAMVSGAGAGAGAEAPADGTAPGQAGREAADGDASSLGGFDRSVLVNLPGAQQIKLATLRVEVAADGFGAAVSETNAIVTAAGGYIASSSSEESVRSDDDGPGIPDRGELVVRVPSERFTSVLQQLGRLGTVVEQGFSGQDVSDQMVDLSSRIETLLAQEAAYRQILDKATSIADILSLQQPLFDVRTQVEQLQAQQAALSEQVAYSTITLGLQEPDAEAVVVVEDPEQSQLSEAWDTARDGLLAVVGGFLIVAVVSVPFLVLALVLAAIGWPIWRRARRGAGTAPAIERPSAG